MQIRVLAATLFSLASCATQGAVKIPTGAAATLQAYSAAFNRNDCSAILRLMSPPFVASLKKEEVDLRICRPLSEMASEGVIDSLSEPVSFHSRDQYKLVIFTNERRGNNGVRQLSYYAVHSSDRGRTWHVLDTVCSDEAWLQKVYPPFSAEIALPSHRMLLPPYFTR